MRITTIAMSVLLAATLGACSSAEKAYCDKLIQCIGGNDHDRDYCIESAITNGKVASDYGCSEAYNSFINCISTTSVCKNLPITNTPYLDGSNCSQNSDALSSCEKAASTRGDRHFLTVP